ncbi:hypothetical protein CMUS01_00888 [Colletotrichum musicola]|uniref:Uncharacterized protein n=1 Tax=Colletotrichum musicola TaxID=2175873 RepID=A0A8H6NY06_9PEZI|nr:hypothetical protein CMUS01_00888 [Colletotrichum musicola]
MELSTKIARSYRWCPARRVRDVTDCCCWPHNARPSLRLSTYPIGLWCPLESGPQTLKIIYGRRLPRVWWTTTTALVEQPPIAIVPLEQIVSLPALWQQKGSSLPPLQEQNRTDTFARGWGAVTGIATQIDERDCYVAAGETGISILQRWPFGAGSLVLRHARDIGRHAAGK